MAVDLKQAIAEAKRQDAMAAQAALAAPPNLDPQAVSINGQPMNVLNGMFALLAAIETSLGQLNQNIAALLTGPVDNGAKYEGDTE